MAERLTKQLIVEAFFHLAASKPVDKISVRDVCREAGVSTVTFYNHFADKAEMYIWASCRFGRQAIDRLGEGYALEDYLRDVLASNLTGKSFLPNLVRNTHGYQSFETMMYQACSDMLICHIAKRFPEHPDKREEVALRAYIHGMIGSLVDWILYGMDESYALLVAGLCDAFPACLSPFVPVWHDEA